MKELLKNIFNEVYIKVSGNEYQFGNKQVEKSLDTFINTLPVNLDEDFLWNFTLFQFAYYDGMKTRFDRIYVNWIYGKKAMERWANKIEAQSYYADQFRLKYDIRKELEQVSIKDWRERERNRFDKQELRLFHCMDNELYEYCETCLNCIDNEFCKQLIK